ncbi:Gfo/Idh/MocA family oxidoreductase [Candidatus Nitrosopumilus sp. SW]|uniref:Gfo/Idh/MocA family protein n=1 Tax=Candidatus Nitrosopumilus sp. SW TaxID=2508726 RepID=UPI001154EE8C|nr:Gfo/Idh/MocA family oxidoreductase [Candidatus Nitrosopumilus sp. SW]QDI88778.1 Gfo/Idh/MocA family oxidoreductase [Candidatus Nitrosopumilus sp. SW]
MKILIVGLGSMGKRRIRNLKKLGNFGILGYDPQKIRRDESFKKYKIETFDNIDHAISQHPNAIIISTPPDLHLKYALLAIKNNIDFFMELNHSSSHVKQIIKKIKGKKIIAAPSCTMRYHPIVSELEKLLKKKKIGKIFEIHHYNGQNLKSWHPWENYKNFFVSKKETGGAKELVPFELNWLFYLFSKIISVSSSVQKVSNLDVDIDDIYQIHANFKNGIIGNFIFDVISEPSFRETRLIGEKGVILCDFKKGTIQVNTGKKWNIKKLDTGKVASGYLGNTPPENIYEKEMKNFLLAVKRKQKYPFSLEQDLQILNVLDAIELSSKKGKKVVITEKN